MRILTAHFGRAPPKNENKIAPNENRNENKIAENENFAPFGYRGDPLAAKKKLIRFYFMLMTSVTLTEHIPFKIASWIHSNLEKITPVTEEREFSGKSRDHYSRWYKNFIKHRKGDSIRVKYSRPNGESTGRLVCAAGLGLQLLDRRYRHTLARDHYVDVDIKNCHPVLLVQICDRQAEPIQCSALRHFVENRDACIQEACSLNPGLDSGFIKTNVVLSLINGGILGYTKVLKKPDWLTSLKGCLDEINSKLETINPEMYGYVLALNKSKGKKHNLAGSVMSKILQEAEDNCLSAMVDFFKKRGFVVGVLCFDGLMIESNEKSITREVLKACEDYTKKITGYSIELAVKAMDEGVPESMIVEEEQEEQVEIEPAAIKVPVGDYFDWKSKTTIIDLLKLTSSVVPDTPELEDILRETVRWNGTNFIVKYPEKNFRVMKQLEYTGAKYKDVIISEKGKEKWVETTVAGLFRSFGGDLVVEKIVWFPKTPKDGPGVFSAWRGWDVDRRPNLALIDPILKHLYEVWSAEDRDVYEYLLCWLANVFQHPGKPSGVMLLFEGDEGTGKSIVAELLLGGIMGDYLAVFCGIDRMLASFNGHVRGKALFILEELPSRDKNTKMELLEHLKYFITAKKISVEQKFCDVEQVDNSASLLAFSNNVNSLPQKVGIKRRSMIQKVSPKYKGDVAYFSRLAAACSDPETQAAFLDYMLSYDDKAVEMSKPPLTEAKRTSIGSYLPLTTKLAVYLKSIEGEINGCNCDKGTPTPRGIFFSTDSLKSVYRDLFKASADSWLSRRLISLGFLKDTPTNNKGLILPPNLDLGLEAGVYETLVEMMEDSGTDCLL